jgi:Ca-activated chloride channel family protein
MIDSFHFIRPWSLLLLIPTFLVIWIIGRRNDSTRAWSRIMDPHLLKALTTGQNQKEKLRPVTLLAAVLVLAIIAVAGPTWSLEPSPFAEDQAALIIVLKVTPSMDEQDVQPSRAERAVQKIHDLLELRSGARTGLIAYSGSAHLVMPLTKDAGIIESFAADLTPAIMPTEGNAAAAAYALAENELKRAKASGSILFITDSLPPSLEFSSLPTQVLGVVGPDQLAALEANAKKSQANFTAVSIDDQDISRISKGIDTSFSAVPNDEGQHWLDQGWWLTPIIAFFTLWWFRPGWVIEW